MEPLTAPRVALIELVPTPMPVAKPPVLMDATEGVAEAQVTLPVRFCVLLSLYVPVAVNCCVFPPKIVGFAGVTAIDCKVGAVGGLIVRAEVLELENVTAVVVDPEIETWYAVGEVTTIELGIVKVTRRTVPRMVVTAVAVTVVIGEPVAVGFRVTVTLEGRIVPEG